YNRSMRTADAYRHGLNGAEAAWAAKQYRGHRVLPPTILQEYRDAHNTPSNTTIFL
ncbi:hypothetical protein OF83DRAFT_1068141, partial [Amylostereum chailletii]